MISTRTIWVVTLSACFSVLGVAQAQRPVPPGAEFKAAFDLLMNKSVQNELELLDLQREELEQFKIQRFTVISQLRKNLEVAPPDSRQQIMSDFKDAVAAIDQKAIDVLLPHQRDRLKQLALQSVIRPSGVRAGLHHERVVAELEIGEVQRKAIAEKSAEVESQVQKRVDELMALIEKVKEDGRREVLATLNPVQREKYEKLFGKPFDLTSGK